MTVTKNRESPGDADVEGEVVEPEPDEAGLERPDAEDDSDDLVAEPPDEHTPSQAPESGGQDVDLDLEDAQEPNSELTLAAGGGPADDLNALEQDGPDPERPVRSAGAPASGIRVGDTVVVAVDALRARVTPAGKQAVTGTGHPILRPRGYSFRVHDQKEAGGRWWVSGGKYWYARDLVQEKAGDKWKHAKRMGRDAARYAKTLVGHACKVGYCQAIANSINGVPPSGGSAQISWNQAERRVKTQDADSIPAGVQVHFKGAGRFGHVAVSIGSGKVVSSDWPRAATMGVAKIVDIEHHWKMELLGYKVVDVNGYRLR